MKDFWAGLKNFLNSLSDSSKVDILMGQLRIALPALGAIAALFGWIAPDHVGPLVAQVLAFIGPALIVIGSLWSLLANSAFSIRKAAAKLPENQK